MYYKIVTCKESRVGGKVRESTICRVDVANPKQTKSRQCKAGADRARQGNAIQGQGKPRHCMASFENSEDESPRVGHRNLGGPPPIPLSCI
jgi:hypothetical protein